MLLPVRQVIIESLDESAPTDPIDLIKVPFEEAVERGIDLVDVSLGKTIEHRSVDLVEITWPYIRHTESPAIMAIRGHIMHIFMCRVTCLFKYLTFPLDIRWE